MLPLPRLPADSPNLKARMLRTALTKDSNKLTLILMRSDGMVKQFIVNLSILALLSINNAYVVFAFICLRAFFASIFLSILSSNMLGGQRRNENSIFSLVFSITKDTYKR